MLSALWSRAMNTSQEMSEKHFFKGSQEDLASVGIWVYRKLVIWFYIWTNKKIPRETEYTA